MSARKRAQGRKPRVVPHTIPDPLEDILERNPPKVWHDILATLVDTDGLRYEIAEQGPTYIFCYVKHPSYDMTRNGCDGCSGPHRENNMHCAASTQLPRVLPPGRFFNIATNTIYPYYVTPEVPMWNDRGRVAGRVMLAITPVK
jgi:hypothetical protein